MNRRAGYTLTELMITVVIIGILATIAIPSFASYIYRSRVTEATNFLGRIKQRQEAYRSEFGHYCNIAAGGASCATAGNVYANYHPPSAPSSDPVVWPNVGLWTQLGAEPSGVVRFRYTTVAGVPGSAVPALSNLDNGDHWFAAQAIGDLDDDGVQMQLEIYSQSDGIWNSVADDGGWE